MNKELNRDIRLGLFVMLGILLFVAGIFMIGSKEDMFRKTFSISAVFSTATGLKPGDYVRYNGVRVGVVEGVQLISDSSVRVDMRIREEKRSFIRKDAVASIASDGLMGDKIINIVSGKEKLSPVENHDVIRSVNPVNMDAMIKTLTETNDNISVITANLRQLTTEMNASKGVLNALIRDTLMSKDLQQSFRNIEQATAQLNSVGGNLQQVMSDVRSGRNSVGAVLQDTVLAQNLSHSIQQIKTTSDQLLAASDQLCTAAAKINAGHGTVNKMLSDSVMAADVEQSIKNIRQATVTLNEDLEALQHSSLLKGYFKKQEKEAKKEKQ